MKLKEMMETKVIHYSVVFFFVFFFLSNSINISVVYYFYGQYLRYMVYHATKPM